MKQKSGAEILADSLWSESGEKWHNRSAQDHNYRKYVTDPFILDYIPLIKDAYVMNIIDLGCGDGSFLNTPGLFDEIMKKGFYVGIDKNDTNIETARKQYSNERIKFLKHDITSSSLKEKIKKETGISFNIFVSVFVIQELPGIRTFLENLYKLMDENSIALIITVHPDFALWLRNNGRFSAENGIQSPEPSDDWSWSGGYPIVDEPRKPFYLPYFHRSLDSYINAFIESGLDAEVSMGIPEKEAIKKLSLGKISPFFDFSHNVYWPAIKDYPSALAFVLKKSPKKISRSSEKSTLISVTTYENGYGQMRDKFMDLILSADNTIVKKYSAPNLYDPDRVTYLIPPITDSEKRYEGNPGGIYMVKSGKVAIGRVFYTKTSGEYLIEELILSEGDIFGEFEVPLSILRDEKRGEAILPPRFNMTYGAWATGPSLNWTMAYPRYISRDKVVPDNAFVAVHPFYIKSKNIRPETDAEVAIIPATDFEKLIGENTFAMKWFLMNVLRKTRHYFEPPSQGYGRSPLDILARLFIRIMAYRMRLGIVVTDKEFGKTSCRTFIGPMEWLRFGLGAYIANLKDIIHSAGVKTREQKKLDVFTDEMKDIMELIIHFPVKDLDDKMLNAMGCLPLEDRKENRYGLLTGVKMVVKDVDAFNRYLLQKGE